MVGMQHESCWKEQNKNKESGWRKTHREKRTENKH